MPLRGCLSFQQRALVQMLLVEESYTGQKCPGPSFIAVLSHWLEPDLSSYTAVDLVAVAVGD